MRHILLADASPTIHTLVRLLLAGEPARVTIATTTADALAQVEAEAPGLVLADTMLPGEGGLAIARRLFGRTPVALLQAPHAPLDSGAATAAGALAVLAKPFDRPTLLGLLRRVFGPQNEAALPALPRPAPPAPAIPDLLAGAREAVDRALSERLDAAVGEALGTRVRAAVAEALEAALDERLAALIDGRVQALVDAAVQRLVGERAEAIIRAEIDRLTRDD